jgi:glucosamine--fructose-6-phosphate aminotransferase (isomerizing)
MGAKIRIADLERLPEWTERALKTEKTVAAQAARYRFMERAVVVGRGLNYSNAFEMALKLMETCYVVAERFSPADLLHGPIAMVEAAFPSFLFAPSGVTWKPVSETLAKLRELRAETFTITDRGNQEAARRLDHGVVLPASLNERYSTIPYIVPAQLLAAHLAAEKGLNPDQPRTLSKVTKTL